MKKIINPFEYNLPIIDLHGEILEIAIWRVGEFINDNQLQNNLRVIINHGIGNKVLMKNIREYLKKHPQVASVELNMFNHGNTIVNIKSRA